MLLIRKQGVTMRYRRTPLEISSPKLRHVYSPGFETPALYLHMFQEDARLYVAPLRSHGDEKFTVEINGEQRDLDRVEALIESISRERRGATYKRASSWNMWR